MSEIARKTIAVSETNYKRIQQQGLCGESFDFVIGRILDKVGGKQKNE